MKLRLTNLTLLIFSLSVTASGQQAKLEGRVFDDRDRAASDVRIIATGGQAATTDSKGHFTISFPSSVQPGQATRIEVAKPNWVIYEPLMGNCVTQSSARNFEPLKVIIVPKKSPLALSPKRLSQVIAQWSDERVKMRSQVAGLKAQLDEYAFLQEYAEKYGFTLDQFERAARQWALSAESDDKEEQAHKEYFNKNYDRAERLSLEAARRAAEDLDQDNKQKKEDSLKVIRRFSFAGNVAFEQKKYRKALKIYNEIDRRFSDRTISKEDFIYEWAEVKMLMGQAKIGLGTTTEGKESVTFLSESVKEHRQALTVLTREASPRLWVKTLNSLANALSMEGVRLEGGEGVRMLSEAVELYRQALTVPKREEFPPVWSIMQVNLGTTLSYLGVRVEGREGMRLLQQAVDIYREALTVHTREMASPVLAAMVQNNLANTLSHQGTRLSRERGMRLLREAEGLYRQALTVRTREASPQDWASTQSNLANNLSSQGELTKEVEGARLVAEAVELYRQALTVRTREAVPQDWAATESELGGSLHSLGLLLGGEQGLRFLGQAVEAHRRALTVRTREALPQQWASTQVGLGIALGDQGRHLGGAEGMRLLEQAVDAFKQALEVYTRETLPQKWALAQEKLGVAFLSQAVELNGEKSIPLLAQSVEALRQVLKVYTRQDLPQNWATAQTFLGTALFTQGVMVGGESGRPSFIEAVEAFRQALTENTREVSPGDWAATQLILGHTLLTHGKRLEGEERVRLLREAVEAFQQATAVNTREAAPEDWLQLQDELAETFSLLKDWPKALKSFTNILSLNPNQKTAYERASFINHEVIYNYAEAFRLNQQWLENNPSDLSAQADFAEKHFTTARFTECKQRIATLLAQPRIEADTKVALHVIEIASLLATGKANDVTTNLDSLVVSVNGLPAEARVRWSFNGTRHFIGQYEKLSPYRDWLNLLLDVIEGGDRETILKGLNEVRAKFKE